MRRLTGAAILAFSIAGTGTQAAEWWQGIWAADPAWCAVSDRIGSVTPAPIAITGTEVLGYENSCRIMQVERHPMVGAVSLILECQSEGSTYDDARLIMDGGGHEIWVWFGGDAPVKFYRCIPGRNDWMQRG